MFAREWPRLELRMARMARVNVEVRHPTRHAAFGTVDLLPRRTRRRFHTIQITLRDAVHVWRCILRERKGLIDQRHGRDDGSYMQVRGGIGVVIVVEFDQGVDESLHAAHLVV